MSIYEYDSEKLVSNVVLLGAYLVMSLTIGVIALAANLQMTLMYGTSTLLTNVVIPTVTGSIAITTFLVLQMLLEYLYNKFGSRSGSDSDE